MSRLRDKESKKHLDVLELDVGATRKDIVSSMRQLSEHYRDQNDSHAIFKLAEIYEASHALLDSKDPFSSAEQEDSLKSENNEYRTKPDQEKKLSKLKFVAVILIIIIVALSIPFGISKYREYRYDQLQELMLNFDKFNTMEIENAIDALPEDFKNMKTIDETYQNIMREMQLIEDNKVKKDFARMRIAYYNLVSIDELNSDWDLSDYFERKENKILLLGVLWANDEYYFRYYPHPDKPNSNLLIHNLPNERDPESVYAFETSEDSTIFGFENKADYTDKFDAYKILSIEEDELRIFCFSNDKTYTLYAQ